MGNVERPVFLVENSGIFMHMQMHLAMRTLCTVLVAPALAGCDGLIGPTCIAMIAPAIQLTVLDSVSGAAIGASAQSIARDGAYADTGRAVGLASAGEGGRIDLAYGRRGTYSVTVSRTGYQAWRRDDIRVAKGECGVITQRITTLLQPAP